MPLPAAEPKLPLKLFISYAHEDDELRAELVEHLAQSAREGLIEIWCDRNIAGGTKWEGDIDQNLNSADIVVLLVSAHFLDSRYCQQEMARAMERGARVVPVILRPSDWETSPFAALQVYPTDGKPVVKWRNHDDGFLNVVKGLRRVAQEISGAAKVVRVGRVEVALRRPGLAVWLTAAAILVAAGAWWSIYASASNQGEGWLDIGRFDRAEPYLRRAVAVNAFSSGAAADVAAMDVNASRNDPAEMDRRLTALLKKTPDNPYLILLRGDQFFSAGQLDAAKQQYQEAVRLRPSLADGFWRLGIVYGLFRDHKTAVKMLTIALGMSPESPRYQDNLAGESFRTGDFVRAAEQYDAIAERGSPVAAVDAASVHRLLGDMPAAEHDGQRALELLKSDLLPEYQVPWRVDRGDEEHFSLEKPGEKQCYAEAEYSVTLWIVNRAPEARTSLDSARKACGSRWNQISRMLQWQLRMISERQPDLSPVVQHYMALLNS